MLRKLVRRILPVLGYDHACMHAFRSQVCVQCGVCHC